MLQISVKTDRVSANLDKVVRRKIPGAIVRGLNKTAFEVRDGEKAALPKYIDRPTPFTLNAFATRGANTRTMTSYVYLKPIQRAYMRWQILGGYTTRPKVVPAKTWPLNAYGNLVRGTTDKPDVYRSTTKYGRPAYFKLRGGKNNKRLDYIGFIPASRTYRKRFPFYALGTQIVRAKGLPKIRREIRRVMN